MSDARKVDIINLPLPWCLPAIHRGFAAQFPYVDVLTVEGRSTFCGASNFGVSQKFGPALSG